MSGEFYYPEIIGSGVALFDYDNDGRLDIYFTNGARLQDPMPAGAQPDKSDPRFWNRLYHQKANGTFEDVTERAGVRSAGYSFGAAAADFDNDGFVDLYVTAYGGNTLYRNRGDGTFEDVTKRLGVGAAGWSTSSAAPSARTATRRRRSSWPTAPWCSTSAATAAPTAASSPPARTAG